MKKTSMNGTPARVSALAACLVFSSAAPTDVAASESSYDWSNVPRVVAIGDVHGAFDNFAAVLKSAGLVDAELRWAGGKTHLVQTGDVLDRGPDSRKCIDLLMDLEKQAKRAGGRVHALIGNHEAMNIVGFLDYVSKEEFASYTDSRSEKRWGQAFGRYYDEQKQLAKAEGKSTPSQEAARTEFESKVPLGFIEHRQAFSPKGRYGKWILGHNVAVRINGIVFSHGDWSEELSRLGLDEINKRVRKELSGKAPLEGGVTFHREGPLQYRGLSSLSLYRDQQEPHREAVDRILGHLGATRMVVGHSVRDGIIESRFEGKHIGIDIGMLELYRGGHQVALEIEGENLRAIHRLGKVPVPDTVYESTLFGYLEAVKAVDPQNPEVHARLARFYRIRGDLHGARLALERLVSDPMSAPPLHHRQLGEVYRQLDQTDQALVHELSYAERRDALMSSGRDETSLVNALTGFCPKHQIETYGWECIECEHSCVRVFPPQR